MEMRTLLVHIFGALNGTLLSPDDSQHQQHVVVNFSVSQLLRQEVQLQAVAGGDTPLQQGGGLGKVQQQGGQGQQQAYDAHGAALYTLAVVLVYGLSIVLLIGSLIKRHKKRSELESWDYEDRQVARYMQQMRDLKEESVRETYRQLKRTIMRSVSWKIPSSATVSASPTDGIISQQALQATGAEKGILIHHPSAQLHLASTDSAQSLTSLNYPLLTSRGRDDSIQSDVQFMLSVIPPSMLASAASDVDIDAAAAAAAAHAPLPAHTTVEVELTSDDQDFVNSEDCNSLVSIAITDVATDCDEQLQTILHSSNCDNYEQQPAAQAAAMSTNVAAAKKTWKLLTVTSSLDVPDTPSAESDVSPAASDVSTSWTFRTNDDSSSSAAS